MESTTQLVDPDPHASKRLKLLLGRNYCVAKPFIDADGRTHLEGEEWIYAGSRFSRYENEFTIIVRSDNGREESFGLIYEQEKQYGVVQRLNEYLTLK